MTLAIQQEAQARSGDASSLLIKSSTKRCAGKVARGPARAMLQQMGYTPILVKVNNESTATKALRIGSPQAGPPFAGGGRPPSLAGPSNSGHADPKYRPRQGSLSPGRDVREPADDGEPEQRGRVEADARIATPHFERGRHRREATLRLRYIGQGTQGPRLRAEDADQGSTSAPGGFLVKLSIRDHDGTPTVPGRPATRFGA